MQQSNKHIKYAIPIGMSLIHENLQDNHSVALNKFDYLTWKPTEYFKIDIKDFYSFISTYIDDLEQVTISLFIRKKQYNIDITRIFIESIYADKSFFLEKYLKTKGIIYSKSMSNIISKPIRKRSGNRLEKICNQILEVFVKSDIGMEDHRSLKDIVPLNAHKINNKLFFSLMKQIVKEKTAKAIKQVSKKKFVTKNFVTLVENLISYLLFLEHKKFNKIYLSNFTGIGQYACILYSQVNKCDLEIYQHGNYLVHGIPCPYKVKYLPKSIHLFERGFISATAHNLIVDNEYSFTRLNLSSLKMTESYYLVATSVPQVFDLDFYYELWEFVNEELINKNKRVKLKLHAMDNLTPRILKFFKIESKVEIIQKIDAIPILAITLNSSILSELTTITNTFDFGIDKQGLVAMLREGI